MRKTKRTNSHKQVDENQMLRRSTRKKRKVLMNQEEEEEEKILVPHLDKNIMSNIFTRVPMNLLHEKFKYQCKEWFDILSAPNFTSKHGIIFTTHYLDDEYKKVGFLEFKGLDGEISELNKLKADLEIMSSSNGLVLVCESLNRRDRPRLVYILNPVTMESISVPRCEHECLSHDLVYVPHTKEHKLVDMFNGGSDQDILSFHVRNIGGSWNDSYCSSEALRGMYVPSSYMSIMGSMYWNERISIGGILYVNIGLSRKIVLFDLSSNNRVQILDPPTQGKSEVKLIDLKGFLGVLNCVENEERDPQLDLWIMKDPSITEWEKIFKIEFAPTVDHFIRVLPLCNVVGTVNDGQVIVFGFGKSVSAYDLKTRIWKTTKMSGQKDFLSCRNIHVNTFVSVIS